MAEFQLATFSADITIPLNHRCMGVLPTKSKEIVDPLQAHGFLLLGGERPLVLVSLDWCEVRNEAYDRWRLVLAKAADTKPENVLVTSIHQHDAPIPDIGAGNLLAKVGLEGELFDFKFHEQCVQRVAEALKDSLKSAQKITHFGIGQAKVEKVASNRRHVNPEGNVSFSRGSRSGSNKIYADAPEGLIDPNLKTLSFWNGDQPVLAMHAYATHPMSYYGRGGVSYDFVGMAREQRRRDDPKIHQIYVSGCSGDVTAGKYNDGSHGSRLLLANRIYEAMKKSWDQTKRFPLEKADIRNTKLELEFRKGEKYTTEQLLKTLEDDKVDVRQRILAAMSLNSKRRVDSGHAIDFPCLDFGNAQVVLFPGESFVGYQLMAQRMKPDSFVLSIGYGECWPGYVPTAATEKENFNDIWLWVNPGSEPRIETALKEVLQVDS